MHGLILALVIVVGLIVLVVVGSAMHRANEDFSLGKSCWHLLIGLPLDGNKRPPDPRIPASRWRLMSRPRRFAWVWGSIVFYLAFLLLWVQHPWLAQLILLLGVAYGLIMGSLKTGHRFSDRGHRRDNIKPAAGGLSTLLRCHPSHVQRSMFITRQPIEEVEPGAIAASHSLPLRWPGLSDQRERMVDFWQQYFQTDELEPVWYGGNPPKLEILRAGAPPGEVLLVHCLEKIAALKPGVYFLGYGANNEPIYWNSLDEDPMLAIGGLTKRGKTGLLSAIIAQGLAKGEEYTLIDPKGVSLFHFAGIPGVELACNPEDVQQMADFIHTFRLEMEAYRNEVRNDPSKSDKARRTLVIEEANFLRQRAANWWRTAKNLPQYRDFPKGVNDNPIIVDIHEILAVGAQFGYRVIVTAQSLNDASLFNARDRFGTVVLFNMSQWRFISKEQPPPEITQRGRAYVFSYGMPTLTQFVCASVKRGENQKQWRQFALAGREPLFDVKTGPTWNPSSWMPGRPPTKPSIKVLPGRQNPAIASAAWIVGTKAGAEYFGIGEAAFKKRRQRRPIFGEIEVEKDGQMANAWTPAHLDQWEWERKQGPKFKMSGLGEGVDEDGGQKVGTNAAV